MKCRITRFWLTLPTFLLMVLLPLSAISQNTTFSLVEPMPDLITSIFGGGEADWGDYDGDGDLDLVIAGNSSNSGLYYTGKIYRNDGGGAFTESVFSLPSESKVAFWGDYDSDGDLDILFKGYWGISVYRNGGYASFTQAFSTFCFSGDHAK